MNQRDVDRVTAAVLKTLEQRWDMGTLRSEADFIAGAAQVMLELNGGKWDECAPWAIMLIGNRSILAYEIGKRGDEARAARIEAKMHKDLMRQSSADDMADFLRSVVNNTMPYKAYDYDTSKFLRETALDLLENMDEYPEDLLED